MADLTITAASVVAGSGATIENGTAGVAITAGQCVYKDTSSLYQLSDANGAAATKTVDGIALHGAAASQPLTILKAGSITIGASVTAGLVYVLSATPGGIAPSADLASGWTTCILGVATSATVISVSRFNSGGAVA